MIKLPGSSIALRFTVHNSSGVNVNADTPPTALLIHNGLVDSSVTLAVTNAATGVYICSGAIPGTYSSGNDVQVEVDYTLGGSAVSVEAAYYTIDSNYVGQVYSYVTGTLEGLMQRALSLGGDNQGITSVVTDNYANPISYVICGYDTAAHAALNDGVTGLINSVKVTNTYTNGVWSGTTIQRLS